MPRADTYAALCHLSMVHTPVAPFPSIQHIFCKKERKPKTSFFPFVLSCPVLSLPAPSRALQVPRTLTSSTSTSTIPHATRPTNDESIIPNVSEDRSRRRDEGRSASPPRHRHRSTTVAADDSHVYGGVRTGRGGVGGVGGIGGGVGGIGGGAMDHEIVQLERRRDDRGELEDILRDALPRMRSRDADSPSMPNLRQNYGGGAGGGGGGFGRLQFGESYQARRAEAEARYDADNVSLADSELTGTTVRTGGFSDDDETMSVDSYASHPSSFGGEVWHGGSGGGRRRVSQMSHRKPSASIRSFDVANNVNSYDHYYYDDDDDDWGGGGGAASGRKGRKVGAAGGVGDGAGAVSTSGGGGVTYGEYVGVGVGLILLLVFSYVVQYLVRHGIIVAPAVKFKN